MPITVTDLLLDRVPPFHEALGEPVRVVVTDNGRKFCGRPDQRARELLLSMQDVEHRTTRVLTPRTDGFVERMNRILVDECIRVAGRTTWYTAVTEIQRDLDIFFDEYSLRRNHGGYRLQGRAPAEALRDDLAIDELPPSISFSKEVSQAAEAATA